MVEALILPEVGDNADELPSVLLYGHEYDALRVVLLILILRYVQAIDAISIASRQAEVPQEL